MELSYYLKNARIVLLFHQLVTCEKTQLQRDRDFDVMESLSLRTPAPK